MEITDIKTYVVGTPPPHLGGLNWVFLKLETSTEVSGFGEASRVAGFGEKSRMLFHPHTVEQMIQDLGERFLIGADPFDIESIWNEVYSCGFTQHPEMTKVGILSAFEMACWDIIGKETGQPIYKLLGGKYNDRLRSYTYIYGWWDEDPATRAEKAGENAAEYVEQGFTALKIDPLGVGSKTQPDTPTELTERELQTAANVIGNVREAVGGECDILIGTHGQMPTHSVISLAKRLEQFNPRWLEEPVPPENRDQMARVAKATSIPVATGERLATKYEFAEVIERGAADILQPALGIVGGILEAKKIAGMAETHYSQIAPWMFTGPIAGAASIQVDVCTPCFLLQEGIEDWSGLHAEILKEPIRWEEGYIIPPDKPGLGVELDEEAVAEHPFREHSGAKYR